MRLNWFLPNRRGKATGVRRVLRVLGPSWVASPLRRIIQAACFLVFLWLFLYVCWPYTAQRARAWHDWIPVEVDPTTGTVTVATEIPPSDPITPGMVLHAVDPALPGDSGLGAFKVETSQPKELVLQPVDPPTPEQLDRLLTSFGPWSLGEDPPDAWPSHYADDLQAKQRLAAESFLVIDPLVSISTALASRAWIWSLGCAAAILLVCLVIPRGFCGYVCPMGTVIDLFDWAIGRRVRWFRVGHRGWWVHLKYYLLLTTLVAALFGVLITGFLSAIPVVTRAMALLLTPLQTGLQRGWHQVPAPTAGQYVSIALFLAVLGLGLLRPRFWCTYVCPSGALFSVGNLLRLTQRKVASSCIECGRCVKACPFDAIHPDFSTRTADCTFCQACGGVCPPGAIQFVPRLQSIDSKPAAESTPDQPTEREPAIKRRGFLTTAASVAAAATAGLGGALVGRATGARLSDADRPRPVRPPGAVPEPQFLQMCVRCGECYQACPNDVLQPMGFKQGIEGIWTPHVVADWSGCEPSCNNCGQVCPTGAIRAIPLEEKRVARMGLAVVDEQTCLPYAGREECQLCIDECVAAGYNAVEFIRIGTQVDQWGNPIEDSGFLAPVVLPERCVGCGLCQTRCRAINVVEKGLLTESAILVEAGDGKEDRMRTGSYRALREQEQKEREAERRELTGGTDDGGYLPDFLK